MTALIIVGTAGTGVAGWLAGMAQKQLNSLGSGLIILGTAGAAAVEDAPADSIEIGDRELKLGGDTVQQCVDSIKRALDALDEETATAEEKVTKDLKKTGDFLMDILRAKPKADNDIIPLQPTIVGASREDIRGDKGLHPHGTGGGGNNGNGGGRGSYVGDDPPPGFEGSIHQTGGDD